MSIVTQGRYYDHAIYVISQFEPSILADIYGKNDHNNTKKDDTLEKVSSSENDIVDVEILNDT